MTADGGNRILVVEDSATQSERLCSLLGKNGFRVTAAATGAQALVAAHREIPALIVSDVVMPGMDGYTFCKAVKSDERLKNIPVILVTTLSAADDIVKGLQCGADCFIRKPYEEAYLLARIEYALTNRALRDKERVQMGVHISLGGERHFITADRHQILDLLISTYQDAVRLNEDLALKEQQLGRAKLILAGLYRIAKTLNSATTEQDVLEHALDEATQLPGVQAGWILLGDGNGGFRVPAARRLPPALCVPGALEGDCVCRRRLRAGKLYQSTNILECDRLEGAAVAGDTGGLQCHAAIPLWVDGRTVGLMNLAGSRDGLYDDHELQIFTAIGRHVGLALERAAATATVKDYARQLADRLEAAELKYQTLMEHANDAIVLIDPQGRLLEANRQAEKLFGLPRTDLIRRPYIDFASPEFRDDSLEAFQRLLEEGTQYLSNIRLETADGRQIYTDISTSLVPLRGERVALAIIRDVTERNRLEQQFQQAQRMEAVGRLAGGVAHDFNNLLTAILGYSDLLLDEFSEDDPRRQDLEEIQRAGRSAESLTRQLLAFSRKQILQPVVLNLNTLVADLERIVRRLIGEDVQVVAELDPELGLVKADPGQIEQVLMNLVVNARDAMPRGGTLLIETANVELDEPYADSHPGSTPGPYVMLAVSDTGHGMSEQVRAHLFEPFFTTKEKGKGTGLGLATVYGIVKQSGGTIAVQSEPGRGASVKIYLPQVKKLEQSSAAPTPTAEPPTGTETILIVEDDASLRILARKFLERSGYNVLDAADGDEALRIGEQFQDGIDLLLTDVVMPGMSGVVLAERLTSLYPKMQVLYSSGYTDDAILQHGVLATEAAFLHKPYRAEGLTRKVRDVLNARK